VKAQDRSGKEVFAEGEDLMARALLHELDHLNGILFVDKIEN
jgi:peptide deformylase